MRRTRIAEVVAAHADAEALGGHLGALVDVSSNTTPSFAVATNLNFDNRFSTPTQNGGPGERARALRYACLRND